MNYIEICVVIGLVNYFFYVGSFERLIDFFMLEQFFYVVWVYGECVIVVVWFYLLEVFECVGVKYLLFIGYCSECYVV